MLTRTNIHTPHPASLSPTSHKNWISDTELLHRKRSVPSTRMIVTTRLRPGNTSVLSVGNGLTVRAASRFITIPIPGNAVSARPFPPFHSFERTDLLTRVSALLHPCSLSLSLSRMLEDLQRLFEYEAALQEPRVRSCQPATTPNDDPSAIVLLPPAPT